MDFDLDSLVCGAVLAPIFAVTAYGFIKASKSLLNKTLGVVEKKVVKGLNENPPEVDKKKETIAQIYLRGQVKGTDYKNGFNKKVAITPDDFKRHVDSALESKVDGIIFRIDSPGGSPYTAKYASDYIKKLEIPTVAVVESMAASAGYFIATACDKIVADNEMSIIGAIGVIGMRMDFSEFLDCIGIKMNVMTTGPYKGATHPLSKYTEEQQVYLKELFNEMHHIFVRNVSENRGLNLAYADTLAEGKVYLGQNSVDVGLVDMVGSLETDANKLAVDYIKQKAKLKDPKVVDWKYESKIQLPFSNLPGMGRGIGSSIVEGAVEQLGSYSNRGIDIK